jgi:hypothetical protein
MVVRGVESTLSCPSSIVIEGRLRRSSGLS